MGSTERICAFVFTEPKNMITYGRMNTASTMSPASHAHEHLAEGHLVFGVAALAGGCRGRGDRLEGGGGDGHDQTSFMGLTTRT